MIDAISQIFFYDDMYILPLKQLLYTYLAWKLSIKEHEVSITYV